MAKINNSSVQSKKKFTLYVQENEELLIKYTPKILLEIKDFRELFYTEDIEINRIYSSTDLIKNKIYVQLADDETLKNWEQLLGLEKSNTTEQRKNNIISVIRGTSKFNETTIKSIVNAISGGTATVSVSGNVLDIKVLPPNRDHEIDFNIIRKTLEAKKPIHLQMLLERYYSTWNDLQNSYTTWGDVATLEDWQAVKNNI